ncbi:hypothetical protein ACIBSW_06825 [Actinoplanes sp. NPDC049668]|uniref:hypothetical protein n=1 Tax=unclassified Actinoplanes TaxID=2626549 RepID=UPI0033AC5251
MSQPTAPIVRARGTAFVGFDGREVRIGLGDEYRADDPLVAAYPSMFGPPPTVLAAPITDAPVADDTPFAPAIDEPQPSAPADEPAPPAPADVPAPRPRRRRAVPTP